MIILLQRQNFVRTIEMLKNENRYKRLNGSREWGFFRDRINCKFLRVKEKNAKINLITMSHCRQFSGKTNSGIMNMLNLISSIFTLNIAKKVHYSLTQSSEKKRFSNQKR